jgi:hypothetical protein
VDRVKPFNFPKSHRIENGVEKMVPETQSDVIKKNGEKNKIDKSKDEIKLKIDTPHHMTTRSKSKFNLEHVNVISQLFTAENKFKLQDIVIKHHSQVELNKSETSFWNSFDPETKYFLLTGDPWNKVTLDRTQFINFEDCPAPAPVIIQPLPVPPAPAPPVRQIPSLPLNRPLPFGPPTQPSIITSAKRQQQRETFQSDSSDSDVDEQFQSPESSPETRISRKDTKRDEFLSNRVLATEKQNFTRQQKKKKIKTPPATPNQWPPAKPNLEENEDQEDDNKGTCVQS